MLRNENKKNVKISLNFVIIHFLISHQNNISFLFGKIYILIDIMYCFQ